METFHWLYLFDFDSLTMTRKTSVDLGKDVTLYRSRRYDRWLTMKSIRPTTPFLTGTFTEYIMPRLCFEFHKHVILIYAFTFNKGLQGWYTVKHVDVTMTSALKNCFVLDGSFYYLQATPPPLI